MAASPWQQVWFKSNYNDLIYDAQPEVGEIRTSDAWSAKSERSPNYGLHVWKTRTSYNSYSGPSLWSLFIALKSCTSRVKSPHYSCPDFKSGLRVQRPALCPAMIIKLIGRFQTNSYLKSLLKNILGEIKIFKFNIEERYKASKGQKDMIMMTNWRWSKRTCSGFKLQKLKIMVQAWTNEVETKLMKMTVTEAIRGEK